MGCGSLVILTILFLAASAYYNELDVTWDIMPPVLMVLMSLEVILLAVMLGYDYYVQSNADEFDRMTIAEIDRYIKEDDGEEGNEGSSESSRWYWNDPGVGSYH